MRPDHIRVNWGNHWEWRTFLPLFDIPTAQEMPHSVCANCELARFTHPLVSTNRPHCYALLCTLHVIKHGIVSRKEILGSR